MEAYKQEFIDFMVESDVLKFGEFTLKSGRKSPFFMNAGAYVTGSQLKKLGEYYAKAIHETYGDDFDVLFGPAYKGIPLGVVTAIAYSELYGKEVRYCSDRKEEKDHGADEAQHHDELRIQAGFVEQLGEDAHGCVEHCLYDAGNVSGCLRLSLVHGCLSESCALRSRSCGRRGCRVRRRGQS